MAGQHHDAKYRTMTITARLIPLTSRPASCIKLLILVCAQLICKQNIVVRVIVIVFPFKVNGDVSLILYHKSIDFSKKNLPWFVCFRFNTFQDG